MNYGGSITLTTPDAAQVTKVRLIRTGAATHSFDHNQRVLELRFTAGGGTVTIAAPANAHIAPPGYYLLFIATGENGSLPSEVKFIRLLPA